MAKLLRRNGSPIGAQITLIAGNHLPFRVSGLGPNKRHLAFRSGDSALRILPLRVNDRDIEQQLKIEVSETGIVSRRVVHVDAYIYGTTQRDANTPRLTVEVLPRLELPDAGTEAGILARMLVVENANPDSDRFSNLDEALKCMQWMMHVMRNRLRLGATHFAARGATTLTELVKAPNQVEGFESYPIISERPALLLNKTMNIANDGTHAKNAAFRTYVENAIAVGSGRHIGHDPSPGGCTRGERFLPGHRGPISSHFNNLGVSSSIH
ncbi:hypothetical protein [Cupriavidus campinensis]|uniref:hypothetical protein n=1 Tax=Cupriavidus campinensis TaxID=151783 RepID=UPI0011EEA339|nr:hypothetical protein [Cupriavidus campinensis]